MTDKITPSTSTPRSRGGQATAEAGTDNDEPGMVAAGERALRLAEESGRASRKAIRKGKSGFVIEDGHRMIIEK